MYLPLAQMIVGRGGVLGLKTFESLVAEPLGNERSHVELVVHDQRTFRLGVNCAVL